MVKNFEQIVYINDVIMKALGNSSVNVLLYYEVKIKVNGSGNSYTELWALKDPVAMKYSLKRYYESCADKCGYLY